MYGFIKIEIKIKYLVHNHASNTLKIYLVYIIFEWS